MENNLHENTGQGKDKVTEGQISSFFSQKTVLSVAALKALT